MLIGLAGLMTGCALPSLEGRSVSTALSPLQTAETTLGKNLAPEVEQHAGQTGILPLSEGMDAFAARVLLARVAEKTLDVQYYIWRDDVTGRLFLQALHQAAERGVRVRLLLDDNGVSGMDQIFSALDAHPNIEVRLFNPFVIRTPKMLGFVTDFMRANRRMHNKSFTADNQASIVGGRNIADEYFGATDGVLFSDLDVLAVGEVVKDVSTDFDRYWSSDSSYPLGLIIPTQPDDPMAQLQSHSVKAESDPRAVKYIQAIRASDFVGKLLAGEIAFDWSHVTMVSDDPKKGLGEADKEDLLPARLAVAMGRAKKELDVVSPYFVPTSVGVEAFIDLQQQGINVRVLTNALESTDVSAVHAGYAKRRKHLLEGGITLYEMRAQPDSSGPKVKKGLFGSLNLLRGSRFFGSSGTSLHAKTFSVDRERVFVGSFNFDPRSVNLNTELGFMIESPTLAGLVADAFDNKILDYAYEVKLDENGRIYWVEMVDGVQFRYANEPGTTMAKRLWVRFLSILPIEWML